MKPYRIKHVPTGLYYKPGSEVNLTKNGKVYTTAINAFNYFTRGYIPISVRRGSKLYQVTKNLIHWTSNTYCPWKVSACIPVEEFVKEEL